MSLRELDFLFTVGSNDTYVVICFDRTYKHMVKTSWRKMFCKALISVIALKTDRPNADVCSNGVEKLINKARLL